MNIFTFNLSAILLSRFFIFVWKSVVLGVRSWKEVDGQIIEINSLIKSVGEKTTKYSEFKLTGTIDKWTEI